MNAEEKVRAAWERAELCHHPDGKQRCISLGGRGFTRVTIPDTILGWAKDEAAAWSAAAAFTDDRLEQIRQIERNIQWLNESFPDLSHLDWACNVEECDHYSCNLWVPEFVIGQCARNRILASQQAALAELRRGMK